jgi:hypothetical protein
MDAFEAQDLDPERRRPSLIRGWEAYRCLVRRAGIRINTRTSLSTTVEHTSRQLFHRFHVLIL